MGEIGISSSQLNKYSYVPRGHSCSAVCHFEDERLDGTTERHKIVLDPPSAYPTRPTTDPLTEMERNGSEGLVIGIKSGVPSRARMRLARRALDNGRRVWFHWPDEEAVECVDQERLKSYWRLWAVFAVYKGLLPLIICMLRSLKRLIHIAGIVKRRLLFVAWLACHIFSRKYGEGIITHSKELINRSEELIRQELDDLIGNLNPAPMLTLVREPDNEHPLPGCGIYLRTDFWAKIDSGGSYGHTCYVAKELAAVTENIICFMPHRYTLLDDLGLKQVVLDPVGQDSSEESLLKGTAHYYNILKPAFQALQPAYIYERLILGNYSGVLLSQELDIPYMVEYNGSEISMNRSFGDGQRYKYEDIYLKAEMAAFERATLITVVSETVKDDLAERGVDPGKILVNPNGADIDRYAPLEPGKKRVLRQELGWDEDHRVVGFIGTFGGWHGVDVLAAAIPEICKGSPKTRFLLIGDGNLKHLVDKQITKHQCSDKVCSTGRVPQREAARLLGACDIYVSPHNSHMVDSKFFGSPTKVFEYMAMGGGIVASDLEQIGQVLSPALRVSDLKKSSIKVTDQRAVLCTSGDVSEFVDAVVSLVLSPEICMALGRNARQAVKDHYSWQHHVARLWKFLAYTRDVPAGAPKSERAEDQEWANAVSFERLQTGDIYKDEAQKQWDENPCGSQYARESQGHTLDWFLEVERYRYNDYAPWMSKLMEFSEHAGEQVLEIGGGLGTDLAQFAKHGAHVTDLDLSGGHLALAQENFKLRGLQGRFIHHEADHLPFDTSTFDLVYSNGVLHHIPNTQQVVRNIFEVLKPGGKAIVMVYAENSLHYWVRLVGGIGLFGNELHQYSMGHIMSRHVELSETDAMPLVKVYTKKRLEQMFDDFMDIKIHKCQLTLPELPYWLRLLRLPLPFAEKIMGWNLVIKAVKPAGT